MYVFIQLRDIFFDMYGGPLLKCLHSGYLWQKSMSEKLSDSISPGDNEIAIRNVNDTVILAVQIELACQQRNG